MEILANDSGMLGNFFAMSFSGSAEARTEEQVSVTQSDIERWLQSCTVL